MRFTRLLLAVALVVSGSAATGSLAAPDQTTPSSGRHREILVLEVDGCHVCGLVKQNILPVYQLTPRAREIPMRFVDATRLDEMKIGLNSKIDTVPTTVLMVDGREANRIAGYWAPETFMRLIVRMIDSAE